MSEPQSALSGARFEGIATIEELRPQGMITLRADLADPAVVDAVKTATGLGLPERRRIVAVETGAGLKAVAWMSPDELLLVLPYIEVRAALTALEAGLKGQHFLAVDVSNARATFRISGPAAREVLAKLCPVDLHPMAFGPGEIRRSRAAQVAAAFWISSPADAVAEQFTLVCFRSVAAYVFDLLTAGATPGGEVGLFAAP